MKATWDENKKKHAGKVKNLPERIYFCYFAETINMKSHARP